MISASRISPSGKGIEMSTVLLFSFSLSRKESTVLVPPALSIHSNHGIPASRERQAEQLAEMKEMLRCQEAIGGQSLKLSYTPDSRFAAVWDKEPLAAAVLL